MVFGMFFKVVISLFGLWQVGACIWCVPGHNVDSTGVGFVKLSGPGTVWEAIGLVKEEEEDERI